MVWERIKRISDAELSTQAAGEQASWALDRAPPAEWAKLFEQGAAPQAGLGAKLSGAQVVGAIAPGQESAALAEVDAKIQHTNLLYESQVLSPAVIELLAALGARDPSDLRVRFAQTAGDEPDREEADRARQELSNEPALLVENPGTALSRPIDQALCAALLKAGCYDER